MCGRTIVLYKLRKISLSIYEKVHLISPNMELAFDPDLAQCMLNLRDWSKYISRSFSSATGVKVELSRVNKCFVVLLPICIILHLLVLKEICHCADHGNRLSKSCCNLTCSWCLKHIKFWYRLQRA